MFYLSKFFLIAERWLNMCYHTAGWVLQYLVSFSYKKKNLKRVFMMVAPLHNLCKRES